MSKDVNRHGDSLSVPSGQPLVGVIARENGKQVTRYFTPGAMNEKTDEPRTQRALALAGAWRDLEWDDVAAELDRIRHQSRPTPPTDDL